MLFLTSNESIFIAFVITMRFRVSKRVFFILSFLPPFSPQQESIIITVFFMYTPLLNFHICEAQILNSILTPVITEF